LTDKLLEKPNIHIGVDFDHTIVDYQNIFTERAASLGYIDSSKKMTKDDVKKIIKELEDGESKWGMLQSEVYSNGIRNAVIMKGFLEFVKACQKCRISLSIISHKTKSNPFDPLSRDLQKPALNWMVEHQFFEKKIFAFSRKQIIFTETIEDKIEKIKNLNCSHFIDDLLKVLLHPLFPKSIRKILYLDRSLQENYLNVDFVGDWQSITNYLILKGTHGG